MKLSRLLATLAVLHLGAGGYANAQDALTTDSPEIVVPAPSASDEQMVRAYVSALSAPSSSRTLMPRWTGPLCLGMTGMQADQARVVNDRIGAVAHGLGIAVRAPGCRPNVLIFFTRDPGGTAQQIADQSGLVFADEANSRGSTALREFVTAPRAVRWWHVSHSTSDGIAFGRNSSQQFQPSRIQTEVDLNDQSDQETLDNQAASGASNAVRVRSMSRVTSNVYEAFDRAIIVVDSNRASEVTIGALSDYLAMTALAQLNPDADVAEAPSILNLFSDAPGPKPASLTSWDLAYLEGLYASAESSRNARHQERQIVRRMMRGN
jgi:hypothetical protein